MQLIQNPNSTIRENGYVSSQAETIHNIVVSEKDQKLYDKAAYVRVYWFIDCLYVGMTDTLNFTNWYRDENSKYNVEALLMLSYEPLPMPTSTTTQKPTTTTSTTTTSTTTSEFHLFVQKSMKGQSLFDFFIAQHSINIHRRFY